MSALGRSYQGCYLDRYQVRLDTVEGLGGPPRSLGHPVALNAGATENAPSRAREARCFHYTQLYLWQRVSTIRLFSTLPLTLPFLHNSQPSSRLYNLYLFLQTCF